jgi:starch phosphorylase
LYADGPDGQPFRQSMVQGNKLPDRQGSYVYTARIATSRPAGDFTPRLIPQVSGVAVPLETSLILWQR